MLLVSLAILLIPALLAVDSPPWWKNAVYYRVLVDSFRDSNGDGLGDLQGLTRQLSYIRALGADAVILSPFSARSEDCGRPGNVDLVDIDQRFGNIEAFNGLLEKAKKMELKVVVTLDVQTVSTNSEWFKSSAGKTAGFEDRVVWAEGNREELPQSDNGIEWQWHDDRNAFFATSNNESLLNLCSAPLVSDIAAAACGWARRGVAGLLVNPDYKEEQCGVQLLRKIVSEALRCAGGANLDMPIILVETDLPAESSAAYYAGDQIGAHIVFSGALTADSRQSATELALAFHASLLMAPDELAPGWMTSSPRGSRIASRLTNDMVDSINLLTLILPGATVIQQGDELGTIDTLLEWANSDKCWPNRIRPSAAPFPWDDSANAGFSTGEPWVPLAPNYRYANAKTEFSNDLSHVGVVRVAAAMRKSPAMGPHAEIKRFGGALAVLRWGNHGTLLVVSNVGRDQTEVQLSKLPGLPAEMTVAATSTAAGKTTGTHVVVDKTFKLSPGETLLLAGPPRHCGGPGPVDKIANRLAEGWQKINKYFGNA